MEILELVGYVGAFWMFLFSARFRRKWLLEFREAGLFGRCMRSFEALVAIFCGVAPFLVLRWILTP